MNSLKLKITAVLVFLTIIPMSAQGELQSDEAYSPNIGVLVFMLEDLKERITQQVKDLDQSQTDFMYDANANSIGALIMHLVSTESYYQIATLEGREWTEEERTRLGIAAEINEEVKACSKVSPFNIIWSCGMKCVT